MSEARDGGAADGALEAARQMALLMPGIADATRAAVVRDHAASCSKRPWTRLFTRSRSCLPGCRRRIGGGFIGRHLGARSNCLGLDHGNGS